MPNLDVPHSADEEDTVPAAALPQASIPVPAPSVATLDELGLRVGSYIVGKEEDVLLNGHPNILY
ncbi:hypothetical protein [Hymenobacter koreensis]|uniref:Uncharacterized protein n=1 Tax=Hymenobacter koreensis TaxID=1084523 RepID=A0ABP8IXS0_9BACT